MTSENRQININTKAQELISRPTITVNVNKQDCPIVIKLRKCFIPE